MKKIIASVFVIAISMTGFSQQAEKAEKKIERITVVPNGGGTSGTTPVSKTKKTLTPAEELKSCEANLKAIDSKAEWIKANPEQLKNANENGWFTDANATKARLEKRIKELKLQLKK